MTTKGLSNRMSQSGESDAVVRQSAFQRFPGCSHVDVVKADLVVLIIFATTLTMHLVSSDNDVYLIKQRMTMYTLFSTFSNKSIKRTESSLVASTLSALYHLLDYTTISHPFHVYSQPWSLIPGTRNQMDNPVTGRYRK